MQIDSHLEPVEHRVELTIFYGNDEAKSLEYSSTFYNQVIEEAQMCVLKLVCVCVCVW